MKTQTQIDKEIATLENIKPRVLQRSAFGDDHHDAIDAQVAVLKEGLNEDEIYNRFEPTGDDDIDGDEGRAENVQTAAMDAYRWMTDENEAEAPSKDWGTLTK